MILLRHSAHFKNTGGFADDTELRETAMKTLAFVVLFAYVGTPGGCAQETYDPDVESKIIAMERVEKMQASEGKDLKTLDTVLDADFVFVDPGGKLQTKSDVLAYVQSVNSLQYVIEGMVVRLHGDTAVVTGLYRMTGAERGKPFVRRGRFVDTWLHKNGRWVAIASLSTPSGS
jgi:ketosteroid isomerase-like protein